MTKPHTGRIFTDTFVSVKGSGGADYFFSAASFSDWKQSLEFYRGVALQAKLKKVLAAGLFPLLRHGRNLSGKEVGGIIRTALHLPQTPGIPEHGSAMIAPTRDKAVIHRHGTGYEKWASGPSLPGVRNERTVYRCFDSRPPRHFACSALTMEESTPQYVRFFMKKADGEFTETVPELKELLPALAEFFSYGTGEERTWADLLDELIRDMPELEEQIPDHIFGGTVPAGLVHRDFKPWNVKNGNKPLFFDFESASFSGCPLEDFFNYAADPAIRTQNEGKVLKRIRRLFPLGEALLEQMNLDPSGVRCYWYWHLLERIRFWHRKGQDGLSGKYRQLLAVSKNEL